MTYIQEFETELRKKLDTEGDTEALIRWISEKVLESYRNGISDGRKGAMVKRLGKSRSNPWYP